MSLRHLKYCACPLPHEIIMSQIKMATASQKESFRPVQNIVQVHQTWRLPGKLTAEPTSGFALDHGLKAMDLG
jgi:hypothetical protein